MAKKATGRVLVHFSYDKDVANRLIGLELPFIGEYVMTEKGRAMSFLKALYMQRQTISWCPSYYKDLR
jgi:hypothetical protein